MAFGWAGAAAGVQGARQAEAELENVLAERAFRQMQEQRIREQMQMEREEFDFRKQQAQTTAETQATDRRQKENQRGLMMMAGDIADQYPDEPKKLVGTLLRAGEMPPAGLLTPSGTSRPPVRIETMENGQRVIKFLPEEDVVGQSFPEQPPTPSAGPQAPVRVETMENGKRVIKFLHPSQVMGQTFEDQPSAAATRVLGSERAALNYYNRGKQAHDAIVGSGFEEKYAQSGLGTQIRGQLWNPLQSGQQQAYRQAQRAFTEARLRKESGAAVPQSEYDNDAKTYFAVPGDSAAVIKQKRAARQAVLDGIAFQSGGAYEEYYGQPPQRNVAGVSGEQGKSMTRAQLRAIAQKHGISEQQAEAQARQQGYTVQ